MGRVRFMVTVALDLECRVKISVRVWVRIRNSVRLRVMVNICVGSQGVVAEVRAVRFGSMWGPDGGAGLGALRGQPGTIEAARGARSCAKLMVTAAIARRYLT